MKRDEPDPRFNPLRYREQPNSNILGDAIAMGTLIIGLAFVALVVVLGVMKAISAI